jgi:hypothetical protein
MKKRRFAEGGFSDIDEGRDTPDQALARKASMSSLASSDKAAGLKASKGEDVGFFKRLSMGNIDAPGSEASNSFGAGKGSSDRMAQAADQNPPVRPQVRPPFRPSPGSLPSFDDFKRDNTLIDYGEGPVLRSKPSTAPNGYKRDTAREDALTLDRESVRKTPTNAPVKPTVKRKNPTATAKKYPKGTGKETFLESIKRNKTENTNTSDMSYNKKGGSIKAYASGGSVSSRADGCAQRGKTRGMMR